MWIVADARGLAGARIGPPRRSPASSVFGATICEGAMSIRSGPAPNSAADHFRAVLVRNPRPRAAKMHVGDRLVGGGADVDPLEVRRPSPSSTGRDRRRRPGRAPTGRLKPSAETAVLMALCGPWLATPTAYLDAGEGDRAPIAEAIDHLRPSPPSANLRPGAAISFKSPFSSASCWARSARWDDRRRDQARRACAT